MLAFLQVVRNYLDRHGNLECIYFLLISSYSCNCDNTCMHIYKCWIFHELHRPCNSELSPQITRKACNCESFPPRTICITHKCSYGYKMPHCSVSKPHGSCCHTTLVDFSSVILKHHLSIRMYNIRLIKNSKFKR